MMNDKWIKTYKALKQLFKILSCSKCKKSLHDPQQFLNCGHFSCISCINNDNTSCVQCELPRKNGNIIKDDAINQIIKACCTIAKEIGFCQDQENINVKPENVSFTEELNSKLSASGNILTSASSKPPTNLPKIGKGIRKRKGNKNLNNNEDSKKAKYEKRSSPYRIPKDINKTNHHGETKLQHICKKGDLGYVKVLLDAGANPNLADYAKWTPLQETVDYNFYDISKLLLDRGANVNQPGFEDKTPLHEAAKNNNIALVNLLLEYKAKKESVDKNGKRPVDYCQSEEIRNLLQCDEDIEIIFDSTINNDSNINNINSKTNHNSGNAVALKNIKDFNSNNSKQNQSVFQVKKEQKTKNSNIDSEFNSQESIDVVNNSINENEQREAFESSQDRINTESEEIDIMN